MSERKREGEIKGGEIERGDIIGANRYRIFIYSHSQQSCVDETIHGIDEV